MKRKLTFIILLASVAVWSIILYRYDARELVSIIGAENGYLITGLVALFGGISSIGGPTYIAVVLTFASAGLSPIGLALASGIGISIGDTVYFYLGKSGRETLGEGKLHSHIERLTKWIERRSEYVVALFAYVYAGFTPLPNDILTVALGALKQRYVVVIPALVLGNFTLVYLLARFGSTLPL